MYVCLCLSTRSGAGEQGTARCCHQAATEQRVGASFQDRYLALHLKAPVISALSNSCCPRCALPGVPGLPLDQAFLQGQRPGRCRRRWGAIVGPQNRSEKGRVWAQGRAQAQRWTEPRVGVDDHSPLFALAIPSVLADPLLAYDTLKSPPTSVSPSCLAKRASGMCAAAG